MQCTSEACGYSFLPPFIGGWSQITSISCHQKNSPCISVYSPSCREQVFSETASQDRATLYVETGAMSRFAPVEYPTSRHLDTPLHKNSLAVSENTPYETV